MRELKDDTLDAAFIDFPVRQAWLYNEAQPYGGRGKAHLGESFYEGENPPFGATFTYYLKEKIKTKKEARQEAEKEAAKAGKSAAYPPREALSAEVDEPAPQIIINISDEAGHAVRRLTGPVGAGMHRVTWDLRYAEPTLAPEKPSEGDIDFGEGPRAPLAVPGTYTVSFAKEIDGAITPLGTPLQFAVKLLQGLPTNPDDRVALIKFQQQVAELYRSLNGAVESAQQLKSRIADAKRAILQAPAASVELMQRADRIEIGNRGILRALSGDEVLRARNEPVPISINGRVSTILDEQSVSGSRPTQTHLEQYKLAAAQLAEQIGKLRGLVESDMASLEKDMEAAGAPWTAGRLPVMSTPK